MLNLIKRVYEYDQDNNIALLGARVVTHDGEEMQNYGIYVGIELCYEDVVLNSVNANAIGVKDLTAFKEGYQKIGATGVVYFPQIDDYGFLQDGDEVIRFDTYDNIEEVLENALEPFQATVTAEDDIGEDLEVGTSRLRVLEG